MRYETPRNTLFSIKRFQLPRPTYSVKLSSVPRGGRYYNKYAPQINCSSESTYQHVWLTQREETSDLQIMKQVFYHCVTAALYVSCNDNHFVSCWDFPTVSLVPGSRIFRPYLVVTCRDFPAVSAVTGSRIFRPYQVVTCRAFPAISAVTGSQIFWPFL
jgi:hypothetical protein